MTKSILLVEDDLEQRALFLQAFMAVGYHVVAVSNGTNALEELGRDSFDLVLTDLYLPECQGDLLIREIKGRFPRMKTVLMSCRTDFDETACACLADETYYKGDLNHLLTLILQLVGSAQACLD